MNIDLNLLKDRAFQCACEHGFHENDKGDKHFLVLAITEIAEAIEADRKGRFHYIKQIINEKESIEIWKPTKGYENEYEVSNIGMVRSKDLLQWGGKVYYVKKGRILKPGLSKNGYYTVALRSKTHKVSRLVAETFLDKNNDNDYVNHIDGDKKNDNINNLEFISASQNNKHAYVTGLRNSNSQSKLTYEQRCEISFLHKLGLAYTTIYKNNTYGVSESGIQRVCNDYLKYTDSVEMEMSDIVIRLLDLAGLRNIDVTLTDATLTIVRDSFFSHYGFTTISYHLIEILYQGGQNSNLHDVICSAISFIYLWSKYLKFDLYKHINWKMEYNELRPKYNGKKY